MSQNNTACWDCVYTNRTIRDQQLDDSCRKESSKGSLIHNSNQSEKSAARKSWHQSTVELHELKKLIDWLATNNLLVAYSIINPNYQYCVRKHYAFSFAKTKDIDLAESWFNSAVPHEASPHAKNKISCRANFCGS